MDKKHRIKIAFCTDGIFPHSVGGIQRHSTLLLKELSLYSDLDIHVIHPHSYKVFENNPNLTEHSIEPISTQNNYLRECYQYSGRVSQIIDNIQPDLIYAQGLTVWKNIKRYKNILINNPHGLEAFQAIGFKEKIIAKTFKAIQRKIFRNSKCIASEGGHLTSILKENGFGDKIVFLPNAVELPGNFKTNFPNRNEKVNVFFMARFVKNKGIHILFESVKRLNELGYHDKFQFILGGKGPLFEFYKENNRWDNVKLLGFISDEELMNKYIDSDVFLLPTLFEGMPTVVLEAMSVSVPVIVSDVGGTPELIDVNTGFLIQRNSIDTVCDALIKYLNLSSEEKAMLGRNARVKVEEGFTWVKLAAMHHELFKSIS